jgi:hypothetical protein
MALASSIFSVDDDNSNKYKVDFFD